LSKASRFKCQALANSASNRTNTPRPSHCHHRRILYLYQKIAVGSRCAYRGEMDGKFSPRGPRVPFVRPVRITTQGGDAELRLCTANLSPGGLFVTAKLPLPKGTKVAVALEAGGRVLHWADAEVRWERADQVSEEGASGGFGLRFTEIRPRAAALVEHLIARGGTSPLQATTPAAKVLKVQAFSKRRRRTALVMALLGGAASALLLFSLGAKRHKPTAVVELPPPNLPAVASPEAAPKPESVNSAMEVVATTPLAVEYEIAIPTGAVRALHLSVSGDQVTVDPALRPNTVLKHIFTLPHPARLVIDVAGREPRYSWQLEGHAAVKSVRVDARNRGTRVVVDLVEGQRARFRNLAEPSPRYALAFPTDW
jgi:hypothetical protein